MTISPARAAAFDVLLRVEAERAYTSVLLPIAESGLSAVDRGLCHELTLGTLRRHFYLDRVIDHLANGKKLDNEVRIALRLALYQIYYLDRIPNYSAINESVELVKRAKKKSASGFVNAILRRATRETVDLRFVDIIDRLSVETSHPRWLIEKWSNDLGPERAVEICRANNEMGISAFRPLRDQLEINSIEGVRPSRFVDGCYVTHRIGEQLLSMADEGLIYFQDEASQLIARSVQIPDGGYFLDVCAAPGGKTGLIARSFRNAMIVAGDLHMQRARMLLDNCRRQDAGSVAVVQYDAERDLPFADACFDRVMVDAPCSGTGTIRHNPEIRYFLSPDDVLALPKKQLSILKNASKLVKPGGTLVYATCSLEPEEDEAVCMTFLKESIGFDLVEPAVPADFQTPGPFARTWPDRDAMDGFFTAAFLRVGV